MHLQTDNAVRTKRSWRYRIASLLCSLTLWLVSLAADAPASPAGLQPNTRFTNYSALSGSSELMRRLLTPLAANRLQQEMTLSKRAVREQAVDLAHENFALYVPAVMPKDGYALFVFVPPWEEAKVPSQWISALDRHGMIFVSAARSGNLANVLDRRIPLALLAAHNAMQRYRVDPHHVYVGGFSGGSRVAERLAVGYPDLFQGALLNAGSDPIGDAQFPLPPADLFRQFQESTQLLYLTGKDDAPRLEMDAHSRQSMHNWCVFNLRSETIPRLGHEPADAAAFGRAIDTLFAPVSSDTNRLRDCRADIERALSADLQKAETMATQGDAAHALDLLKQIDSRFGGLGEQHVIEIEERIRRSSP